MNYVALGVLLATPALAAPGKLTATKWSGEMNIPDPVACSVDDQGRVYVTETTRRKSSELDIRDHTDWIPSDVKLRTIEEKRAFYKQALAPGMLKGPRGGLQDHNRDGSVDWNDLTVMKERIWRIDDANGDGIADVKHLFYEGFNTEVSGIAAGVLWHQGSVYATVTPDLWKMEDFDGDGKSDISKSIIHGFGHHIAYSGHDMHGLTVGPDGRIYWTIGDKGIHVKTKDGTILSRPNDGGVLRCEPDGTRFEIFAHGLRNVQEIAFDEYGNLFGVDNDADKSGEKERFVYITENSDSGWRCCYQYMKDFCPWVDEGKWKPRFPGQTAAITPPLASSHDGPAGFAYNPGTALGPQWQGYFFLNQFPSGKMNAIRLAPDGAAFKITEDVVVSSGIMGIGMSWGPDGKLYFADWSGGYPLDQRGAIWTLDDASATNDTARLEVQKLLKAGFAKRPVEELVKFLSHSDVRIRRGAQFELAAHSHWKALQETALNESTPQLGRIHAIWGLGQGARQGKWLEASTIDALLASKDAEIVAQTIKVASEATLAEPQQTKISQLLAHETPRVRFFAGIALGRLQVPSALPALITAVQQNNDKDAFLRHAYVVGLTGCAKPTELVKFSTSPEVSVRRGALLTLSRLRAPECAAFLKDADLEIVQEAARAIYDEDTIETALPQLASMADSTADPLIAQRALNAAFRVGSADTVTRLVKSGLDEQVNAKLRKEALTLLALWTNPPVLDRADGRNRDLQPRDPAVVRNALKDQTNKLLSVKSADLKPLALGLLAQYKLDVPAAQMAALIKDNSIPNQVRSAGLKLLAEQHPNAAELRAALSDILDKKADDKLRVTALTLSAKIDPPTALKSAIALTEKGSTLERQTAWSVIASLKSKEADAALQQGLANWAAVPKTAQLDLLEACAARAENISGMADTLAKLTAASNFAECIEGGDAAIGREITLTNVAANCVACHQFEGKGGSLVGPDLSSIGREKERAYLLESLVQPSAVVRLGYGLITISPKTGDALSGTLVQEDAASLKVKLPDGTEKRIARADIANITPPMSVMPPMHGILTKRQLRDVVAYLATQKKGAKK